MQIILFREENDSPILIDVPDDADLELLIQMIQLETGIPMTEQVLVHNDIILQNNSRTLYELGIYDGHSIIVKSRITVSNKDNKQTTSSNNQYTIPENVTPEQLLSLASQNPAVLRDLKFSDPEMAAVLETNDVGKVRQLFMHRYMSKHREAYTREKEFKTMLDDPTNPDLQKKLEEEIQQQNINENMAYAIENLPEAYGRVIMLYVDLKINKVPVKAFVDSGAQSTIMSIDCAEKCGITRFIDKRFSGEARGVGTAKIIGKVHAVEMQFGSKFIPISVTILEKNDIEFLFGLDMLKSYRCCIDLAKNVLRLEINDVNEEISFLSESQLPDNARGTKSSEIIPQDQTNSSSSSNKMEK